jgi:hypothetical protein
MTPALDRVEAHAFIDWTRDPDAVTVFDVRSPAAFEATHVAGSDNVPLTLLGEPAEQLAARSDRQVVQVCASGARAATGGEVVRGRARWPMERQVRLLADSLVVAGVALGLRAPKAAQLAGGVGTGPTASALTDTSTMARLLSVLPDDRRPHEPTAAEMLAQLPGAQQAA